MSSLKKWYNFETGSLRVSEKLREKLLDAGIQFELSGNFDKMHYEILLDAKEKEVINDFIMML